nr:unnamed protein product [Callosobruchus analis]
MVSQPASQLLGDLVLLECDDQDDNAILQRIKRLAVAHLPEGWKSWKVFGLSRKDGHFRSGSGPPDSLKDTFCSAYSGSYSSFLPNSKQHFRKEISRPQV